MAEEDIKFSEQLFLSSYINELIERTGQSITTGQKQFEYVTKFDTTRKSISEILALLRGKSENLKISPDAA